jgi:hypothetical protein
MPDVLLFKRVIRVQVGTIEIKNLDMSFTVDKSIKPEPNKAELHIWNLNEKHRSAIEQLPTAPVMIEAGYEAGSSVIFLGDLRTAISTIDGPNIVTSLASGDGEKKIQTKRIAKSFAKGAKADVLIKATAEALGVGEGNLADIVRKLKLGVRTIRGGTVIYGNAARELTHICRCYGLTYSIQNGNLQFLELKTA